MIQSNDMRFLNPIFFHFASVAEIYTVSHEVLFADTFINGGDGGGQGDQGSTPSLTEAILETDSFLVRAYM